jgi:hypothetical protein
MMSWMEDDDRYGGAWRGLRITAGMEDDDTDRG